MKDNAGKYYIYNGELKDSSITEMPGLTEGKTVYEVIRLIDGVPLFLQDHHERMKDSIISLGYTADITYKELADCIRTVSRTEGKMNCNVKIMLSFTAADVQQLIYISKSYYPDLQTIENGVSIGMLKLERKNPNIKQINHAYKEAADKKIKEGGYFEILLQNADGTITEGSKSNAFFVKGSEIFTAPGSHVLKGITRKFVLVACKLAGFEVIETLIHADSLKDMDGLFLSGTSIKVLPVSKVEELSFNSSKNPVIQAVREEYDNIIKKYIDENVKIW